MESNIVSTILRCQCNDKLYKNNQTLKQHLKSNGHLYWQLGQDNKNLLIRTNRLENELDMEKRHKDKLMELNLLLIEKIKIYNTSNNTLSSPSII